MKLIFFGSDDFAAAHLEYLLREKFSVAACVTQPDKPRDRMKVTFSPIKEIALREKIDCLQPDNIKDPDFLLRLKTYGADLFVVIAYGKILPQSVLDIPKIMPVNVHGSILPKYRGAAPINWAVINGETETGITIIRMSADLDAGDVLCLEKLSIGEEETAESVRHRMMEIGPLLLADTLNALKEGKIHQAPQNPEEAVYAPKLTKEMARIDWTKSAQEIHNLVRGLTPWPKAYTRYQGKMLKILRGRPLADLSGETAGEILGIDDGIAVACGSGVYLILEVHPESSHAMSAADFVRGSRVVSGDFLR